MLATLAPVLTVGCAVMAVLWSRAEHSASIATALATKEAAARKESQAFAEKEAKARGEAQEQERIARDKAEQLAREDYVNRVNRAIARSRTTTSGWPRTCSTAARRGAAAGSGTTSSGSPTSTG